MNIFLIGYRCTGKTNVGHDLAAKLKRIFIDADVRLVEKENRSIADIVSQDGWDVFRQIEKSVLQELCTEKNQVIATGGGVILDPSNVSLMKKHGTVIWLKASVQTIYERMTGDQTTTEFRPALTDQNLLDEINATLTIRQPLYKNAMDFEIDTDGKTIDSICLEIMKWADN